MITLDPLDQDLSSVDSPGVPSTQKKSDSRKYLNFMSRDQMMRGINSSLQSRLLSQLDSMMAPSTQLAKQKLIKKDQL